MEHYYRRIYNFSDIEGNKQSIGNTIRPIERYLKKIETKLKNKTYKARYRKLQKSLECKMRLIGEIKSIPKKIIIISDALKNYNDGENISYVGGMSTILEKIDNNKAVFDILPQKKIFSKDNETPYDFTEEKNTPEGMILYESKDDYIVYDLDNKYEQERTLTSNEYFQYISTNEFWFDGNSYNLKIDDEGNVTLNEEQEILIDKTIRTNNKVNFILQEKGDTNKGDIKWIELLEYENEKEDEDGVSYLEHFFDDNATINDNNRNYYRIEKADAKERLLLLSLNKKKCYPPKDGYLEVKFDTKQIRCQISAVDALYYKPISEYKNILNLLLPKSRVDWKNPELEDIKKWFVLTDEIRAGSKEQRRFVQKAISTPDFAFLSGPPGSGKTTTIIELICQLISSEKSILLCGSTHVAIDNVLERIDKEGLIEKVGISPLRIGDKNRIGEGVEKFQIDEVKKRYEDLGIDDLIIKSSNLVCGTTMGILSHPDFIQSREKKQPILPMYDYLIIDESSKTTFQEFLVPALYAKHWILVGDTMQLSPYTDPEYVKLNLEDINIEIEDIKISDKKSEKRYKKLEKHEQEGLFLIHKIMDTRQLKNVIIPVSKNVFNFMYEELKNKNNNQHLICFVGSENRNSITNRINYYKKEDVSPVLLSGYDIIIISSDLVEKCSLPETHEVLWRKKDEPNNWEISDHVFRFSGINPNHNTKDENELYEKTWSEEIAWRIERKHQLRLREGEKSNKYREQIRKLLPEKDKDKWIAEVDKIASIAFPSVLEALEKGTGDRKHSKNTESTILQEGFDRDDLLRRREVLTYQHRMHSDISKFSRENFYSGEGNIALQDNMDLDREWKYDNYPKRCFWINIDGKEYRGKNEEEARKMIEELKKFVSYAKENPKPKGEKWEVACLSFYRGQEKKIKEELRKFPGQQNRNTNFDIDNISIKLCTVDRFQGQEADIVFLSMVKTRGVGFMDSPNRLNVALTRARYQNVIIGKLNNFLYGKDELLQKLAEYASGKRREKTFYYKKNINENNN